jgi:hypothetical protein
MGGAVDATGEEKEAPEAADFVEEDGSWGKWHRSP